MFIIENIQKWMLWVLGAITTIVSVYVIGRSQGSSNEKQRQTEIDIKQSKKIEDVADRARKSADNSVASPVERLRKHKRLRDL